MYEISTRKFLGELGFYFRAGFFFSLTYFFWFDGLNGWMLIGIVVVFRLACFIFLGGWKKGETYMFSLFSFGDKIFFLSNFNLHYELRNA